MIGFLYSVVGFVIAIGVLVVVHEFGHYWVAKSLGIKVLRFSVGFGKPLFVRRMGVDQTEYALSAVPLGGYVKMLDENEGEVASSERHRAFNRQSLPKRMAVVVAGPLFNLLFAVLAYTVVLSIGMDGVKPVVGKVVPNSIAAQAGFQAGDRLLSIDGRPALSWDYQRLYLFERALDRRSVHVEVRDPKGAVRTLTLDLAHVPEADVSSGLLERALGLYGYIPQIVPTIGVVEAGSPAAHAGLQPGDRIVRIDGAATPDWQAVVSRISASPGRALSITIMRAGAERTITVTPKPEKGAHGAVGKIGAGVQVPKLPPDWRVVVRLPPSQALAAGIENTWAMSLLTVKMLFKMVTLQVSTSSISGPITIAQYAGYSVQIGLDSFLMFLAVVSISLGVLNLLPIPILDGGHLLYYIVEAIKGSPLSDTVMGWGQRVGIALLLCLMAVAFYNDFTRILH